MALGPRLDLRQSQSLVMTPQLQQAIRLLALSNLEVESFIAEEIERNPLLDAGAGEEAPAAEPAPDLPDEPPGADSFGSGEAPLDLDAITPRGEVRTLPFMWSERGGLDGFYIARLTL